LGFKQDGIDLRSADELLAEAVEIGASRRRLVSFKLQRLTPITRSEQDFVDRREVMKDRRLAHVDLSRQRTRTERVRSATPEQRQRRVQDFLASLFACRSALSLDRHELHLLLTDRSVK